MKEDEKSITLDYLEMLEYLVKRDRLYLNDLLYQTAIYLIFVNKAFVGMAVQNENKIQAFTYAFIQDYEQYLERFNKVYKIIEKRAKANEIEHKNVKALEQLKTIMNQQFEELEGYLMKHTKDKDSVAQFLGRLKRDIC